MERKSYVHKPLVYIEQPTISEPKASMQQYYQSEREHQTKETNKIDRPKKQRPRQRPYMHVQSAWEHEKRVEKPTQKRENFSELSVREKINYLLKRPQFIPTLTCQIRTTDGRHYGKIINFKDDTVSLRLKRSRATKRIPFDTIEDIRIVGF